MMVLPFGCKHATEPEPTIQSQDITDLRKAFSLAVGQVRTYRIVDFAGTHYDTSLTYTVTKCDTVNGKTIYTISLADSVNLGTFSELIDSSEYIRGSGGDSLNPKGCLLQLPIQNGHRWLARVHNETIPESLAILAADSAVTVANKLYQHAIVVQGVWHTYIFVSSIGIVMDQETINSQYWRRELISKNF
jgi:hypothetical protein